ncbi:MAG: hypothetical protein KGI27_00370 [Thaumarchaeota archaeon]|nr:hypothetical protein [Nitrososphaerota archaeon]
MKCADFLSKRNLSVYIGLFSIAIIIMIPAYADPIVKPTSGGTLNVKFDTDPATPDTSSQTMLKISFIDKKTQAVQPHIDYYVTVTQGDQQITGAGSPDQPLHTAEGSISIPIQFPADGTYQVNVGVEGIVFQPIPPETVSFTVNVGSTGTGNNTPSNNTSQSQTGNIAIPSWIKNNAKWWSQGQVGDQDFVKGIQYLIQKGIMQIPTQSNSSATSGAQHIPAWIKTNAGWWASGQISDQDFVKGIQWLVSNGIIMV